MPRVVRVYDPQRQPPEWNRLLSGTEVAVFLENADGSSPNEGDREPTCEIFDELQSAEAHCKQLVNQSPQLRCLIFDSSGRAGDPVAIYEGPKIRKGELTSRFRRWFSALTITSAVVLIWIDWRSDFERMWPSVLAWKFVTTALVFITWESVLLAQRILAKRRAG